MRTACQCVVQAGKSSPDEREHLEKYEMEERGGAYRVSVNIRVQNSYPAVNHSRVEC